MNAKLGLALLSIGCAAAIGLSQSARADSFRVGWGGGWHGHSGYSVSLGLGGPGYYGGYYAPAYYRPARSCFYDDAGYYVCQPNGYGYPGYYGGGYYAPAVGISYYSGWGPGWGWNRWGWRGRDWDHDGWRGRGWDHDGGWRGHDRDHDGDGWRHDHDDRAGGWDRGHYHRADVNHGDNRQSQGNRGNNNWHH